MSGYHARGVSIHRSSIIYGTSDSSRYVGLISPANCAPDTPPVTKAESIPHPGCTADVRIHLVADHHHVAGAARRTASSKSPGCGLPRCTKATSVRSGKRCRSAVSMISATVPEVMPKPDAFG